MSTALRRFSRFCFFFGLFFDTGNIKNTEKLNYSKERAYKLTVTAFDCGKNRASEDVLVKINVKPTCKPSWQGIKVLRVLYIEYTEPYFKLLTLD